MAHAFQSFFMGGFECATHRRRDGLQIDVLSSTGHAIQPAQDYTLLAHTGIRTVRDGLRWHLIESGVPGDYDWSSFLPMLHAARDTQTQVLWDLCHWGVPAGLDIFSPEFVTRFEDFAAAVARLVLAANPSQIPYYCAINEVSFWAWVGGDVEAFAPHQQGRGPELKRQLVRACLAAIRAVRGVDPRARFIQAEPIIDIVPNWEDVPKYPEIVEQVRNHTAAQFEAWDMLLGIRDSDLGGHPDTLDFIGVNYYWNNQWVHGGDRKPPGHPDHKPLHRMLVELYERYGRPIVITETGAESGSAVGWLAYICGEVREAVRLGADITGICLYPVMDYPGWDDDRHCYCGLLQIDEVWDQRSIRKDLVAELTMQMESTLLRRPRTFPCSPSLERRRAE
jgi:beta-glucosidase/6-phospho-beta-glucosidase/beta-galactosidase